MSALVLPLAALLLTAPAATPVDVPAPDFDATIVDAAPEASPPAEPPPDESPEVLVTLPPCRPGIADPRCPGDGALPVDRNVTTNQLDPNVWAPAPVDPHVWAPAPVVPALYR